MSNYYGMRSPSIHVGSAVGNLVVLPNSADYHARMFARAGARDPQDIMRASVGLIRSNQWYCLLMMFTGTIALLMSIVGAHAVQVRTDAGLGIVMLGVSLWWLWMLRVFNGWILHWWLKPYPNKLYNYVWFFPITCTASLRMTNIRHVLKEDRTVIDRAVVTGGTVMWFIFIKLPLYVTMGYVVVALLIGLTGQ